MFAKEKHPYNLPKKSSLANRLYHPTTAGVLSATLATFGPRSRIPTFAADRWQDFSAWALPEDGVSGRILGVIPRRLYVIVVAFTCGYVYFKCVEWLRIRTVKSLLTYRGWVYNPRSLKTKLWGMLLRVLSSVGGDRTFSLQKVLPKQPLPDLDMTLDRWLGVSKQYVSKDEYESTKESVASFRSNEGPQLQTYLTNKSKKTSSWLADYWLTAAYLSNREPIAVNNNYYITTGFPLGENKPDKFCRAATWIHNFARFDQMLSKQEIPPLTLLDTVPLCMNGYSFAFGTVRIPGDHMDTITKYNDKHVIVIRNGHFFKMDMYARERNGRKVSLLTYEEIRNHLQCICDVADGLPDVASVAALTAQNRGTWAKQRLRLQKNNKEVLHAVESSMFIYCLDKQSPENVSEFCKDVLTGNGTGCDRWYDKCFTAVTFDDAMTGINVEHSVIDATVFGTVCEYAALHEHYDNGKLFSDQNRPPRNLPQPEHLEWDLRGLEEDIKTATDLCRKMYIDLDLFMYEAVYGKGQMKKMKISPDGYIQMMFQLAYYRLYKEVPKTYEPSTGRLFLLGRTETVHPGSPYSVAWLKAMDDPSTTKQTRQQLFRKAVKHQNQMRLDATVGQGCDRHLLGLLCASRELGMDLPALFRDKAWRLPFVLSTSQTPTRSYEYGTPVDFCCASGGFGPGAKDGYGISYIILGDDRIHMAITSWKSAYHTGSVKFASAIDTALKDTKEMLS